MNDTAWDDKLLTNPHAVADKRSRVQRMFSAIAPSYDLNNRLHSFWRDQAWRRKAVKIAQLKPEDIVVDVACGTGDLTLAFAQALYPHNVGSDDHAHVIGIDFTYAMLPIANAKWTGHGLVQHQIEDPETNPGAPSFVRFLNGDAQALPLPDACCDVVSIAFGIRNVQDIPTAFAEFHRVLRPGGRVIVLEFSEPTNPFIRSLNRFYCHKVMPTTATLIARDKSGAYKYLPKSIETFISRERMVQLLSDAGFESIEQHPMTFGVCVCYRGIKPA
jgi:demethylmenaquinone methyltransferase / 2-methoxy-6-polyprenyl-1,4-benzoquinol methylase